VPHYLKNPLASVLVEFGETKVLCVASCEDYLPSWMRNRRGQGGWVTAEYSLLPGSTSERSRRERQALSGRTQEIQRLIGRALRAVIDLRQIGERTITVDCDVLQADGSTRTAAVTGAYVVLKLAVDALMKSGKLKTNPLLDAVAGVSVGLVQGQVLVDLDYEEDLNADADLNVIMTHGGKLLEIQGCAEKTPYSRAELNTMLDVAAHALEDIFTEQRLALDA
jgi:ribonuclease PH